MCLTQSFACSVYWALPFIYVICYVMCSYLTDPSIVSSYDLSGDWSVLSILNDIANANPCYHALIDTGALITGMSNLQVARYLLEAGLPTMDGVVFLDHLDRKMVSIIVIINIRSESSQCTLSSIFDLFRSCFAYLVVQ